MKVYIWPKRGVIKPDSEYEYMAYYEGRKRWCDNLIGVNKVLTEGFKYHSDWNKLMEVWAALNKNGMPWYAADFHDAINKNNISKAYESVVKAITQLNNKL